MPQQPLSQNPLHNLGTPQDLEFLKAPLRNPLRMSTKPSWDYFRVLSDLLRICSECLRISSGLLS